MDLNPNSTYHLKKTPQEWKKSHIIEHMRTLVTLIFKREAEGKHAVIETWKGGLKRRIK